MKYAIAIWNYAWDARILPGWIHEFADRGFDAISFHPKQFSDAMAAQLPAVVTALRERHLTATVHGACTENFDTLRTVVTAMRDHLYAVTLDSAMREDSRGRLHNARRIAAELTRLQELTAGTEIRLAIEDFPLDAMALEHYADALGRVYEHPRTGILVDVGHMHIRRQNSDYFGRASVGDYFRALPCPLVELHLHDNHGDKDQHAHFGHGTVPVAEVAQAVTDLGFDGVCTIEIAPGAHGSTPEESKSKAIDSLMIWQQHLRTAIRKRFC